MPQRVIDAVSDYLAHTNANNGGAFVTSRETEVVVLSARRALAHILGTDDPGPIAFGPNMTTLTFFLSRALARTWKPGDEVIVSRLDHDANVSPWVLAAQSVGVTVRHVDIRRDDCTLDVEDLKAKISPRTRLLALGCASNAVGTINAIKEAAEIVHDAGGQIFLDAVHYAPHAAIDVTSWNCDYLACSAYKFFGPHVGVLWGKRELMAALPVDKVRPASDELPDRWMNGTQNHEGIAGVLAAIDYLADLGRRVAPEVSDDRGALRIAFDSIGEYERDLSRRLLAGLAEFPDITVWGITDLERLDERVPTVAFTHARHTPLHIAEHLAERGIFVWSGNFYALGLTEALGLEPEGLVRIGLLHYNTAEEVDRLLEALGEL